MKTKAFLSGTAIALVVAGISATAVLGQQEFGDVYDVDLARNIWASLDEIDLVGDQVVHSTFYEGVEQHGFVLETFYTTLTVGDETGLVIVKRNYGPEGVSIDEVRNNPDDHLAVITVMFQDEGFNSETNDWFWVAFMPDGNVAPAGEAVMAGNVPGCIGCHSVAPGGDWVYTEVPGGLLGIE